MKSSPRAAAVAAIAAEGGAGGSGVSHDCFHLENIAVECLLDWSQLEAADEIHSSSSLVVQTRTTNKQTTKFGSPNTDNN